MSIKTKRRQIQLAQKLDELARRGDADVEERRRRRKILPAIARRVACITHWNSKLRCLQVADAIYHRKRGRELLPGNATTERQIKLIRAAWRSVIRWKLAACPEHVTETERDFLRLYESHTLTRIELS